MKLTQEQKIEADYKLHLESHKAGQCKKYCMVCQKIAVVGKGN